LKYSSNTVILRLASPAFLLHSCVEARLEHRRSFFLLIGVLSRVFRGKFVAGLRNAFHRGELQFPANFCRWLIRAPSPHGCEYVPPRLGRLLKRPFGDRNMYCAISAPAPIASPSPTPAGRTLRKQRHLPLARSAHGNKKRLMI